MTISTYIPKISAEQKFMISVLIVNGGNYLYNLALGRILGPQLFADAALLITLLLVLSFVAMTFQVATAKFSVLFQKNVFTNFINLSYRYAAISGTILGILLIAFARDLQHLFNTQSHFMFTIFGFGVPIYFVMSVNRGIYQGKKKFNKLAITYQGEMIGRLVITLLLLFVLPFKPSVLIAIGIVISFGVGLVPFKTKSVSVLKRPTLSKEHTKHVHNFFVLTAFYEFTQIIINNSDILMVKHYFDQYEAGLYASLALIGRVVYFVAWMAPLLWKYAIATSLFAVSNIFAYYFLSLDKYIPVLVSGLVGISQILLIICYHDSLAQVVDMQIIAMIVLLVVQLIYTISSMKQA